MDTNALCCAVLCCAVLCCTWCEKMPCRLAERRTRTLQQPKTTRTLTPWTTLRRFLPTRACSTDRERLMNCLASSYSPYKHRNGCWQRYAHSTMYDAMRMGLIALCLCSPVCRKFGILYWYNKQLHKNIKIWHILRIA